MEHAEIHALLAERLGDAVIELIEGVEPCTVVAPDRLPEVAAMLRDDPGLAFDYLMCLSGVDWDGYDTDGKGKSVKILGYNSDGTPEQSDRVGEGDLGVVYHLYSPGRRHKFTMQVRVPREPGEVPSLAELWPTAAWHEREAWDLVGIRFTGHPDLRRILLEEGWVGHPLRKDYVMPGQWDGVPLEGRPYADPKFTPDDVVLPPGVPGGGGPGGKKDETDGS